MPLLDVAEDDRAFRVAVELPGLSEEDVSVSLTDRTLTEERNIDDQAAWLDDATVTYALPRSTSGTPTRDTYAVAADGSSAPRLLVSGANSLRVVPAR